MTDTSSRTISLNDIALKYIGALQRITDIAAFSWAAADTATEQGYNDIARQTPGLPSTEFHLAYEPAADESARWVLKQTLNEALGLAMIFLDDVRKMSALVAFNAAKANATGDLTALAAELNAGPYAPDFAARLKQLNERYQITTVFEPEINSLAFLARFLFQSNGIVPEGATLTIQLRMIQPPGPEETQPKLDPIQRQWTSGQRVTLTRNEHAAVFTTLSLFVGAMLNSVQEFAKRSGLPDEPPKQ